MDLQQEMPFASQLIRKVALRMVGKTGLRAEDLLDLQQDLWLHLLERMHQYDPSRGHSRAFITKVVKNKAATILKARAAAKRGSGLERLSLNDEFEDEDGDIVERHQTISVDDFLRRTRGTIRSEVERRELAMDIRTIIKDMLPHEYVVCLLLIDENQCAVANVVGLPRSTLRDMIKHLREIAEGAGLDDYLK